MREDQKRNTSDVGSNFTAVRWLRYLCLWRWNAPYPVVNLPWKPSKGGRNATDAATFPLNQMYRRRAETPGWLSPSCLSRRRAFPRRAARVNPYRQRYRRGPALYLAASITLFHPVARLDGLRFVRRITRCSSLKTPRCWGALGWQLAMAGDI